MCSSGEKFAVTDADMKSACVDRDGKVLAEVSNLPLAEDIPITFNSVRKGPRNLDWRDDKAAELSWIETQVSPRLEGLLQAFPHMTRKLLLLMRRHNFCALSLIVL